MNKKGFTLVELLAVIAILAILVIIALPNVMTMFNNAKKESYITEAKEIIKVAEQTWISDSMFNTKDRVYIRCEGCTGDSLDLSGRNSIDYYIKIDKSGKIVEYYNTDGTYQYEYKGQGLKVEDIKNVDQVSEITEDKQIEISCEGSNCEVAYKDGTTVSGNDSGSGNNESNTRIVYIDPFFTSIQVGVMGDELPDTIQTYDSLEAFKANSSYWRETSDSIFFKAEIDNYNKISQIWIGYTIAGSPIFYLQGLGREKYDLNKTQLADSFGSGQCTETNGKYECNLSSTFGGSTSSTQLAFGGRAIGFLCTVIDANYSFTGGTAGCTH